MATRAIDLRLRRGRTRRIDLASHRKSTREGRATILVYGR
jgi:hypothetical protein